MDTLLKTFHMESRNYRTVNSSEPLNTCFDDTDMILLTKQNEMREFISTALNAECLDKKSAAMVQTDRMFCCGCTACKDMCPKQCISMREDAEGFLYPTINDVECIHCGMCHRVCPVEKNLKKEINLKCFAGYTKNITTRKNSSSGGIFTELAQHVLNNNGVVYGVGFDSDYKVVHLRIEDTSELPMLQGSKYVQSDMGETYCNVKKDLDSLKMVYFSGTPCQVKGLYTFLQRDYENLITQDIICHGVASPKIWREYISKREEITQVSFRDKKYGWHYFSIFIKDKTGEYRKRLDEDTFIRLFLDNTILRPICYNCPLKKNGSVADITLADCWGAETLTSLLDEDKGISLILSNTDKGYRLLSQVSDKLILEQIDKEKAVISQSALKQSVRPNEKRAVFFHEFTKTPYETLNNWYEDSVATILKRKYVFYKTELRKTLCNFGNKRGE
jgi:coenzyme F420-reducing hydrogenase beta subunit